MRSWGTATAVVPLTCEACRTTRIGPSCSSPMPILLCAVVTRLHQSPALRGPMQLLVPKFNFTEPIDMNAGLCYHVGQNGNYIEHATTHEKRRGDAQCQLGLFCEICAKNDA
jgi:hypothetical protein